MSPGLTVERLSVDRGGRAVLRDLSFHLPPGAAILVTGSNGAGKSTLLRAVAGLIPRVGGAVRLGFGRVDPQPDGRAPSPLGGEGGSRRRRETDEGSTPPRRIWRDPSSAPSGHLLPQGEKGSTASASGGDRSGGAEHSGLDLADHTSYLGHGNGLKLSLTAAENLGFMADWSGRAGRAAGDALEAVGLRHVADFPVRILSAGQRRRVALAGLLVARRPLWLLDEPATALDAAAETVLGGLLRAHLGGGGMMLAAIHAPLDVPALELRLRTA